MAKTRKVFILLTMFSAVGLMIAGGCKKDDSPAQNTTYNLKVKDVLGVTGTITFTETSSTATTIDITVINVPAGIHPANLYMNSIVENGAVNLMLNPIDAAGKSSTVVTTMTYAQLTAYDGCIRILKSSNEPNVILAQADIGGNVITNTNKTYTLSGIGVFGVSGNALFEQRVNGNTLVSVTLTGTIPGALYPATINLGSIATVGGGPVVKLLNSVDGTTGKSFTNIQKLENGTGITYNNWLVYDGYINIYQVSVNAANIICHGNIGSN